MARPRGAMPEKTADNLQPIDQSVIVLHHMQEGGREPVSRTPLSGMGAGVADTAVAVYTAGADVVCSTTRAEAVVFASAWSHSRLFADI